MARNPSAAPRLLLVLVLLATGTLGCTRSRNPFARPTPTPIPTATQPPAGLAAAEAATATPTTAPGPQPSPTATATTVPADTATPTIPPVPTATPTPVPPSPTPTPTHPITNTYVVQLGDTLYTLARRYNTTVERIVQDNNIADPNTIRVGQVLKIFGRPSQEIEHVVAPNETLFTLAVRYGTSVDAIVHANNIVNPGLIFVGQRLKIVPGQVGPGPTRTYTVQGGDTLISIALRFGTTSQAIAIANNLPNPNLIYPGQVLRIP